MLLSHGTAFPTDWVSLSRQQVVVRWIPKKGFGLFTSVDIKKGQFLCIYAGELISTSEARTRWAKQKANGESNYILVMREVIRDSNGGEQVLKTTIDPRYTGNIGRFMSGFIEYSFVISESVISR